MSNNKLQFLAPRFLTLVFLWGTNAQKIQSHSLEIHVW